MSTPVVTEEMIPTLSLTVHALVNSERLDSLKEANEDERVFFGSLQFHGWSALLLLLRQSR